MTKPEAPGWVEDFKTGDEVPEWLIAVDPRTPEARRGSPRFSIDCSLYRINGALWLIPTDMSDPVLRSFSYVRFDDAQDVHIYSVMGRIYMPLNWYALLPIEEKAQ